MKLQHARHKATGKTALVMKAPDGCVLAQFDDLHHPHAYRWHLYTRSAFQRAFPKNSPQYNLRGEDK